MNLINKKKLLLVEDNTLISLMESKMLKKHGYEVQTAISGEEAVEIIRDNNDIDLILMDVDLGKGINGIHAAGKIIEIRNLPVVFLTSHTDKDTVEQIKSVSQCGYISKNSEESIIISSIEMGIELFQLRKKLDASEKYFHQLADSINEVFWIRDINNRSVLYVNPAYEKIWGRTCRSFYKNPWSFAEVIHPDDRDRVKKIHKNMRLKPLPFQVEFRIVRDDGEIRWILTKSNPIFDEEGNVFRYAGISEDITRRKYAINKLKESNKQLSAALEKAREFGIAAESANISKSQFLANISHEIRTPMNGIIGIISLLRDTELTSEQTKFIEIMRSSSDNLLAIINQILDLSKIELQNFEQDNHSFNLHTVMYDIIEMLSLKAGKKNLAFNFKINDEIPCSLYGDSGRIRQVVTNLSFNAIKFTDEGKINIEIEIVEENETDVKLKFSVADTGIGIPEEQIKNLFTPFTQIDGGMTRRYGGTGLGLAISKKIVELMGGEIGVESSWKTGSLFWFTVKLKKQDRPQIFIRETEQKKVSSEIKESATILLVEDNKTNQFVANAMLKKLGYKTELAMNGFECIDALKQKKYDVVFMDCQMPDMDGFQATEEIRSGNSGVINPDVLIIALTAHAMDGDREKCIKAGMNDYIAKPINPREIDELLNKWLGTEVIQNYKLEL